jgi:hypothetical protein
MGTTTHDRQDCTDPMGCAACTVDDDPGYLLVERAGGGWWVMRDPADTAGDTQGYVDGWVECLVRGAWRATSWDRETVTHGATCDSAAQALVALRYDPAIPVANEPDSAGDGPLGPDPGTVAAPDPQPYTDDELAEYRDLSRDGWGLGLPNPRWLATVDAERARADVVIEAVTGALMAAGWDEVDGDAPEAIVLAEHVDQLASQRDAERARAEEAEAELRTMRLAHRSLAAIARRNAEALADFAELMDPTTDEDGRALDASPTEGTPE